MDKTTIFSVLILAAAAFFELSSRATQEAPAREPQPVVEQRLTVESLPVVQGELEAPKSEALPLVVNSQHLKIS